jgi:hypothetical protein
MGSITAEAVRRRLKIAHTHDDTLLGELIDAATQEACRFMNRTQLPTLPRDYPDSEQYSEDVPSSEDPVVADVVDGVMLLIRGSYEGGTPDEIEGLRRAAESKFMPYRVGMGV